MDASQYSSSNSDSDSNLGADASKNVLTADSTATGGSGIKRKRSSSVALQNIGEAEQFEEAEQLGEPAEAPKAAEKPDGRSWVWGHFKKIKKPVYEKKNGKRVQTHEVVRAKCNYCAKDFSCDTYGNGTSTLHRHIDNVCKKYPGRVKINDGQQKLTSTGRSGAKELVTVKWSDQGCREAAVKMIVMDELPFSFIEKEGFRYFYRYIVTLMKCELL
ncbi:unnamed protein product [Rhodiola kirilowii]